MVIPDIISPSYNVSAVLPTPEDSYIVKYRPLSSPKNANKIDFETNVNETCAIDPNGVLLFVKFKVVDTEDKPLPAVPAGKFLGCISDGLNGLFSNVTVSLNNYQVSNSSDHHLSSYLINLFNYPSEFRKTALVPAGWQEYSEDEVGTSTASAFTTMQTRLGASAEVNAPLFLCQKFIPPGVKLGLNLVKSATDLFLVTSLAKTKVQIIESWLQVRYVRIGPQLLSSLQSAMLKTPYLISYVKQDVRSFTIPATFKNYSEMNLYYGKLPSRIIAFFVPTTRLKGSAEKSCYKFTHANLNGFNWIYNDSTLPHEPIPFDMATGKAEELYYHTLSQLNMTAPPYTTSSLSYESYCKDFFFLACNFQRDQSYTHATKPNNGGFIGINLSFSKALTENCSLVLYAEYANTAISISPDGSVALQ